MTTRVIAPLDREQLRARYQTARPFPHMVIDRFLEPSAARAASDAFFSYDDAKSKGLQFKAINENLKIQITDPNEFPEPIKVIANALADQAFLDDLSYVTGINNLIWDPTYAGGGMHQSARSGWLDVHVDFNYNPALEVYRRLNILLYLNARWEDSWGGLLELWDEDVTTCFERIAPIFNRCVVFSTSEISFHGVTAVQCPEDVQRCSFAAYYYTKEPPEGWDGTFHSTKFKARPEEHFKRNLLMPGEAAIRAADRGYYRLKKTLKRIIGIR